MRVALGFKAHSGWAACVALGDPGAGPEVVDRRRLSLVEESTPWAKAPYHAAQHLAPEAARALVQQGLEAAPRAAGRALAALIAELRTRHLDPIACAVLMPRSLPSWSAEEILSVHVRMHQAEGALFPRALCRAVEGTGLELATIPEKALEARAEGALGLPMERLSKEVSALGRAVGPPWGKDQKLAALAALVALREWGSGPFQRAR